MRKTFGFLALAGIVAVAVAQGSGAAALTNFAKAINSADTVSSNYTIQVIGSAPESYSVVLKKPNLARVETPGFLIVADGKNVYRLDKSSKSWYKQPQNDGELKALFATDETGLFAGFFNSEAYKAASVKSLGAKNRKGQQVEAVQTNVDPAGKKQVTYFVSPDNIARGAQYDLNDPKGKVTYMLDAKTFEVNGTLAANAFAFEAPADTKEVSLEELGANKWYTNLHEAMAIAKKSNRKIFVDFMATWCGPCKMLEREVLNTSDFKKLGNKLVFLRIDVDEQKDVARTYKIEAMPTQMVLDSNGNILAQTVGYGGPNAFYSWLRPNL
jgi:outer membrane lipoprotein-sorting protein